MNGGFNSILPALCGLALCWLTLCGLPAAHAQTPPTFEVEWERVGTDDDFTASAFFTAGDSAVFSNGTRGRYVIRPGDAEWTFIDDAPILSQNIFVASSGTLFAISNNLARSTDFGRTWVGVFEDITSVIELPPSMPGGAALVATENAQFGIARSTDDGATWTPIDLGEVIFSTYVPRSLAFTPSDYVPQDGATNQPGRLVTTGLGGGAYSDDGGQTWHPSNLVGRFVWDSRSVVWSDTWGRFFSAIHGPAPDGGSGIGLLWESFDGATWSFVGRVPHQSKGPARLVMAGRALWALDTSTQAKVVHRSEDGGRTWERSTPVTEAVTGQSVDLDYMVLGPEGRIWVLSDQAGPFGRGRAVRTVEPVVVATEEAPPGKPSEAGLGAPYPNPATDVLTVPVTLAEAGRVRLALVNTLGQTVRVRTETAQPGSHPYAFDTAGLAAGVYVVVARLPGEAAPQQRRVTVLR